MPVNEEICGNTSEDPISSDAGVSSGEDERFIKTDKSKKTAGKKISSFESIPDREHHEKFLKDCVEILLKDAVFQGTSRENKVLEWHAPDELFKIFDFTLKESSSTHEELKKLLKETVQYSVKIGHPYFVNQLYSGLDPYGLVGQWMTDSLNPSVYTYEVSPMFSLMEEVVLREMRSIIGFPGGKGDGIFAPGGSMSNGYAIACARYNFNPKVKETGLHSLPRLIVYTSEDAHYSVKKLASFLGLGTANVYAIRTDEHGRMCMQHLKEQIERTLNEGAVPLMVCATAGTTVLGAFDPIEEIAHICEEHKMWMHVDAAWGGGALMSRKYRYLLKGIDRADSVTWNPHKLLAVPQQCSTLLLRHEGLLTAVNSSNAAYLFQKDKFYDTQYDTGDKHIQCGRRVDVFKFWFMWKAKGTIGFEKHVDKVLENARFFTENIKQREGFKMVLEQPEFVNVCFWYVPPSLRGCENEPDYEERLHKIAPKIKEKMMKNGSMMVTYQAQRSFPNFFRMVFQSSALDHSDMLYLIEQFEQLGKDL